MEITTSMPHLIKIFHNLSKNSIVMRNSGVILAVTVPANVILALYSIKCQYKLKFSHRDMLKEVVIQEIIKRISLSLEMKSRIILI